MFNFHDKKFRITFIEGPETEVNKKTIFEFKQDGLLIYANYAGGKVKHGHLIGIITGNRLSHKYVQVNLADEINAGEGNSDIRLNGNKLQIVEEWEWASKDGKGKSIMEEI